MKGGEGTNQDPPPAPISAFFIPFIPYIPYISYGQLVW